MIMIMYDKVCVECKNPFQSATKRKDIRCEICRLKARQVYQAEYQKKYLTRKKPPAAAKQPVKKETVPLTYDHGFGHLQAFMGDKGDDLL